ncbi:MAG TPA: protein phosphatase 2C domain-containing protein [Streptosporangiaceae bacterium]
MTSGLAPGADHTPGWLVLTASERGASHVANRAPNQDAVATERAGAHGVVAAVADGHGHSRHLRSARGSKLAVRIGCQVAQELADRLESAKGIFAQQDAPGTAARTAGEITKLTEEFLVPAIVSRWREAVLADVKADPFTESENGMRHTGDDATIAYGSTLLLAMVLRGWLILAQIGDGDVVGVRADGRGIEPVPADPQLDGLVTTSLCGADPRADFRVAAVEVAQNQLLAVLLATDGYGNAQMVEKWPSAFAEDLAWMLKDREVNWLASQLPLWAARCASSDGSADDTTVALLISPAKAGQRAASADSASGSEETTIPAVPHADTVPVQVPDTPPSMEPVTMRQLAHRTAPEPVILERSTPRRKATEQAESHEPATTEIPRLRRAQAGNDHPKHDAGGSASIAGGAALGGAGAGGDEPPTTEWRPPGAGAR